MISRRSHVGGKANRPWKTDTPTHEIVRILAVEVASRYASVCLGYSETYMDDILAVVTDLFFQSRISAAAHAAGRRARFVLEVAQDVTEGSFSLALVDLDARTDVLGAIRRLKANGNSPVVAFGPHVDTEGRKAARAAGADRVLAKSKFVTELPRLMQDAAGVPSEPTDG